jgi:hypothetical protein
VCGRTLLRGEHADVFLHGGARRMVCELCTPRAAHEGWIREGLDDARVRDRDDRRPRSLLGRLRSRLVDPEPVAASDNGQESELEPAYEAEPAPEPVPEPVAEPAPQTEALPDMGPRTVHAIPTNADLKVARAVELFNSSSHTRTVMGVSRSLGAPVVAVRPSATEGSVVTIVVAWELSWYRFEVDLADEAAGVRVVAQGAELDELDAAEQEPNAAADDSGALHLAARHA